MNTMTHLISSSASACATFIVAATATSLHERTLIPLYATIPTKHHLDSLLAVAVLLGHSQRWLPLTKSQRWLLLSILCLVAPIGTFWVAATTARWGWPVLGPLTAHVTTLLPILVMLFSVLPIYGLYPWPLLTSASLAGCAYFVVPWLTLFTNQLISYFPNPDGTIYHALAIGAYGFAWINYQTPQIPDPLPAPKKKSKRLNNPQKTRSWSTLAWISPLLLVPPLHKPLSSPILPHPLPKPFRHPEVPLTILSSVESVTGLIVVGEIHRTSSEQGLDQAMHSVRFMRANHSLLGGLWTDIKVFVLEGWDPWTDSFGDQLGDSVYAAFNIQEAVLLANHREFKNGLIIGLGTGVSATAFMRHNIATTIVEIDPAVYEAARTYFGLPDPGPGKVFLEDARTWVNARDTNRAELFDFVVHDCFSGGGVPEHIFTVEFFHELKKIMVDDGILVLNVAGFIDSETIRLVFRTVTQVFPQCRGYHDQLKPELTPEQHAADLMNIVWFCTSSSEALEFRESDDGDWLGSPLRRHVLSNFSQREIPNELLTSIGPASNYTIITDADNQLGKMQDALGFHHWQVMREVMSDVYWEIF
ncbi:spermidine synthase [Flagelloscypha sp. PMI_526]|nr:spermidine synthase [Flagelloscypha sp. PMI_526]